MDAIREQLKRPLVAAIAGGVLGLIIGLFFAWIVWPTKFIDTPVDTLRADLKENWLRMAINSYVINPNPAIAKDRYDALGDDALTIMDKVSTSPAPQSAEAVNAFRTAVQAGAAQPPLPGTSVGQATSVVPGATPLATQAAGTKPSGSRLLSTLLLVMCIVTILLLGAVGAVVLLRNRNKAAGTGEPGKPTAAGGADWAEYAAAGEEPPMAQFMASYKLGDDLFDDSFSIDSPGGEFLGECGVGISETIGVGDPKKVTAFEVWLFDKNDIQTVTKVVMSEHAFQDDTIRQRLAAKGEPVLAAPGGEVVLETQTLQLVARIVDISYGDGALPENSFFDNLVLQLAVWQK